VSLRHFSADELIFDQQECFAILRFFFIDVGIQAASLTVRDRSFAQALLVEAVDASYRMGFVEIVFDTFFGKTPVSMAAVRKLAQRFLRQTAEHWFRHATRDNLSDPKIYESVRATLARNARSAWRVRLATDELTY
jgi:hypothetical protein